MTTKTTILTTTDSDLKAQIEALSRELETERAKTKQFGSVLGQLAISRNAEVLELEQQCARTNLLKEIDTVFNRAL